jgi:hypothetical protein
MHVNRLLIALAVLISAGLLVGLVGPLGASGRTAFVSGNWSQVGANAGHTGASRDTSIGLADVGSIVVRSQDQAPGSPAVLPAISHAFVYVPTGYLPAFGGGLIESGPTSNFTAPSPTGPHVVYVAPGRVVDEPVVDNARHRFWVVDSTGTLLGFTTGCTAIFPALCSTVAAQANVGACPTACTASRVFRGGVVVASTSDGNLAAYRADCTGTCTPLWHATVGAGAHSTPSIAHGLVYVGSSGGSMLVFRLDCGDHGATCTPLWHVPSGETSSNTVAVAREGTAFWTSADGNLYGSYGCTPHGSNPSCSPQIVTPLGAGPIVASPLIDAADQQVIATLPSGVVEAFRIERCPGAGSCALIRLWSVTLPFSLSTASATPSLADGVIWIGDTAGFLHAIAAAGCGAPTCSEIPIRPGGFQLVSGAIDGMSTEVAGGAVWTASETPSPDPLLPPSYLLTTVVPG